MLDKNKRYRVRQYGGIAWYYTGQEKVWIPYTYLETDPETGEEYECESGEGEWEEDPDGRAIMIMVGDDREFKINPEDCTELDEDDYCHECGQIGCTHDGRDRGAA